MKQAIVDQLYAAILVGLLAGGIVYPPLHGVAAVLAWFSILAGSLFVIVGVIVAYLADNSDSLADRRKCREILSNIVTKVDKRSKLLRRLGLAKAVVIALLLAVSGMTFSTICYGLVVVLSRAVIKLHRAVLETELP